MNGEEGGGKREGEEGRVNNTQNMGPFSPGVHTGSAPGDAFNAVQSSAQKRAGRSVVGWDKRSAVPP